MKRLDPRPKRPTGEIRIARARSSDGTYLVRQDGEVVGSIRATYLQTGAKSVPVAAFWRFTLYTVPGLTDPELVKHPTRARALEAMREALKQ